MDRIRKLSGAQLKWIAMISMLIDHIDKGILLNLIIVKDYSPAYINVLSTIFGVLGRIAFPIFLFLLVEGFEHTRSRLKYFMSLLGFGILAEIPYDMFGSGVLFDWGAQNMYFTLALALLVIWIIDIIRKKLVKAWAWIPIAIVISFIGGFIASYLALDYHFYGIFIPVIFYIFRQIPVAGAITSYLVVIKEFWSFLGFLVTLCYNGKRGQINKWFCYIFYPAHLLIIGLIRMLVLKC